MRIGIPKEIKNREGRVALTPAGAETAIKAGHLVLIQEGAGVGAGFSDTDYLKTGARVGSQEEAWSADLVVKVKEPLAEEFGLLGKGILFTFLHLAGVNPALTAALLEGRTSAIAYETVEDLHGRLPLLAPMSAVAGDMAAIMGNYHLAHHNGGKGALLGAILGRRYGKALIIGDGVVGRHAAATAYGMGANVCICGKDLSGEELLRREIGPELSFIESTPENISKEIESADLVVCAVLIHGAKAPKLVTEAMVKRMQPGSVIVDVSIDQGGCAETSCPTSHSQPTYETHGVLHYCVTNMPGAYPRTATLALTAATLPYMLQLAEHGLEALNRDPGFAKGLNCHDGRIACRPVAEALRMIELYAPWDG